ncbi:MAG: tRNA1(Val) (adenine(37)-N6)-methyltransferase [Clostridia bacterium]|nr:tRNA1(Val) (adenine(37)-N6)-methyltransferase [Clostridia bacterium]
MKEILIDENEQIDDLLCDGLRIIQRKGVFRYGTDAVLLANSAVIPDGGGVLDIGTGTGIIPILLSAKSRAAHLTGLEIQPHMAEMARRSVKLNSLEDKIDIVCGDICDAEKYFKKGSFDAIVTNPPYKRAGCGLKNENDSKTAARHEIHGTLDDFIRVSSVLLKNYGHFNMICRPDRLCDTFESLRKYKIEPKELTFVHSSVQKPPVMFLLHAVKGGGKNLVVTAPVLL